MKTKCAITGIFLLVLGCSILSCKSEFETLTIESITPKNHEYGVTTDTDITIRFNNDVNKQDIEELFSLYNTETTISGTFTWTSNSSFIFTPVDILEYGNRYEMYLPESIRDRKGNTMQRDFFSDFTIGNNFERPEVIASSPAYTEGGTRNVSTTTDITIDFSHSMNYKKTESAFSIYPNIQGTFSWSEATPGLANSRLTFNYTEELSTGTQYTITIDTDAENSEGTQLQAPYTVMFFTTTDTTIPVVTGIHDASILVNPTYWTTNTLNENISKSTSIAVQFSEPMDKETTESAFSISPSVSGEFSWDTDAKLVFTPNNSLSAETVYTITIQSSAQDLFKNTLGDPYVVLLKTNNTDSAYITILSVQGSTDNSAFTTLFSGTPVPGNMPYPITRSGDGHYYLLLTFSNPMDVYSAYGTLQCDPLDPETGSIETIEWTSSTQLKITLQDLAATTTYRFTVSGGSSGLSDTSDNVLETNFVFEIRE